MDGSLVFGGTVEGDLQESSIAKRDDFWLLVETEKGSKFQQLADGIIHLQTHPSQ